MGARCCFTVFTATFDRARTLPRLYEALCAQTYRDFEWLVVDDGSTDGTRQLLHDLAARAPFRLRYLHQENRGKHCAFNAGVQAAEGELFLSIDSDDTCAPHALERFKHHWDGIPAGVRARFTGVTALAADQHGTIRGERFPLDVTDSDSNEIFYRHRVTGDKWGFHRTEVLRDHPFPEIPGTRFVPEGIVWSAIARRYKTRFVNEVLLTVWLSPSGAQLSTTPPTRGTAAALARWHCSTLNGDLRWFRTAPGAFVRSAANFSRFSLAAGVGLRAQRRQLARPAQLLWLAAMPLGVATSWWDRIRNPAAARPRAQD
jgi:glycosyltransferase involved in cell wall biosynthesis